MTLIVCPAGHLKAKKRRAEIDKEERRGKVRENDPCRVADL